MGGDHAPEAIVAGALEAASEVEQLVLVGKPELLEPLLAAHPDLPDNIRIQPSGDALGMSDQPVTTLKKRPDASIRVAAELARRGEVDAVLTAGSTGAMVAAASLYLKRIRGLKRTALAVNLPTMDGRSCTVLDIGATVNCRPVHLLQFAVMGRAYVRALKGIEQPRIGLLNIGREASKGNEVVQKTAHLLENADIGYAGFVEGETIFSGGVDVAICEGFVGNVLLKVSEGLVESTHRFLTSESERNGSSEQLRPVLQRFRELTDYAELGGAPLLGVKTLCVICHGKSDARAIARAIGAASRLAELPQAMRSDLEHFRAGRFTL